MVSSMHAITTNNINTAINVFSKPDISHLINCEHIEQSPMWAIIDRHGANTPMALINEIWFNSAVPANHSIRGVNAKTAQVEVYDGLWITARLDEIARCAYGIALGRSLDFHRDNRNHCPAECKNYSGIVERHIKTSEEDDHKTVIKAICNLCREQKLPMVPHAI